MELELSDEKVLGSTILMAVGCGGGGCNTVNRMIDMGVTGIKYMGINTDYQALMKTKAEFKVVIGKDITNGLGAGGNPDIGRKAAEKDSETIKDYLKGIDMVFITTGMGGGTGTGAAPVVARIAKEEGCLTVAIVTLPFKFEKAKRMKVAMEGIDKLKEHVDILIQIPNDNVFKVISDDASIDEAFLKVDSILQMGIQGISDIINYTGNMNIDFADVVAVMKGKGEAVMGIGKCTGKENIDMAVKEAVENPLLSSTSIDGAQALLVNFRSSKKISMPDFEKIMGSISSRVSVDSLVISGQHTDEGMKDEVIVTVIATGFNSGESAEKEEKKASEDMKDDKISEEIPDPMATLRNKPRGFSDTMWLSDWQKLKAGKGIASSVPPWERKTGNENQDLSYPTVYRSQQGKDEEN